MSDPNERVNIVRPDAPRPTDPPGNPVSKLPLFPARIVKTRDPVTREVRSEVLPAAPLASTDPTPPDALPVLSFARVEAARKWAEIGMMRDPADILALCESHERLRAEHADLVKDRDRLKSANAALTQALIDIRGIGATALTSIQTPSHFAGSMTSGGIAP